MNGDTERNSELGEHPESRQRRENKLQQIQDLSNVIKEGNRQYMDWFDVLSKQLSDLNTNAERLIDLAIQIKDILKKG